MYVYTVSDDGGYLELFVNNPVNWFLVAWNLWVLKQLFTPPSPPPQPRHRDVIVLRGYTLKELREYNGDPPKPVYMAVCGKVYDVSRGRAFYGPGGPYQNFAGRDASRGLAKHSFDLDMLRDTHDPLDDLTASERETLNEWQASFDAKYDHIGWVIRDE